MNDLGNLQSVHKISKLGLAFMLFAVLLCFILFAVCFFSILSGQPVGNLDNKLIILVSISTFLFGLLFSWIFIKAFDNKLEIYENGVFFHDRKSQGMVKWNEIQNISESVINNRGSLTYFYTINTKDGRNILVGSHLKRYLKAAETIIHEAEKRGISVIWIQKN